MGIRREVTEITAVKLLRGAAAARAEPLPAKVQVAGYEESRSSGATTRKLPIALHSGDFCDFKGRLLARLLVSTMGVEVENERMFHVKHSKPCNASVRGA